MSETHRVLLMCGHERIELDKNTPDFRGELFQCETEPETCGSQGAVLCDDAPLPPITDAWVEFYRGLRSSSYTRAYLDRLVRDREGGIGSGD